MQAVPGSGNTFVGRGRELEMVRARLDRACAGTGGALLLAGEPGIGKTRLAEESVAEARRRGMTVLWGRCHEGEGAPAFWPWVQILRAYLRDRDGATVRQDMAGGAADIATILPELRDLAPDLPQPPPGDPEQIRFRLFDAIASFLGRAAVRRPLLLVLDDLHWADTASLALLGFLADEIRRARVLILATYRDSEATPGSPLSRTLAELARVQGEERILLTGLAEPEVRGLITAVGGAAPSPSLVFAIAHETEGNPFFITELVRLIAADGRLQSPDATGSWSLAVPHSVREVVGRRLETLSDGCRSVLTLASVVGREFELAELASISELPRAQLLIVLEEAETARVLLEAPGMPGRFRFSHALVRETLYAGIPGSRRVLLHKQAAEALDTLWRSDPEPHLAELAYHFVQAAPVGDPARAADYARRAAERAMRQTAYEEAAAQFGWALWALDQSGRIEPGSSLDEQRCEILLALGEAHTRAGDLPKAREAFFLAAECARSLDRPDMLARAALGCGEFVDPAVHVRQVALLEEALAAQPDDDTPERARLMGQLAELLYGPDAGRRRAELANEAVEMARRLEDPETLAFALNERHWILSEPRNVEERLAVANEMMRLAERGKDRALALKAYRWRIVDLLEMGDIQAVDAEIAKQTRLATQLREQLYLWHSAKFRTMRATLDGRFAEADELLEQAFASGQRMQMRGYLAVHSTQLFVLRREQGRVHEAEAALTETADSNPNATLQHAALALLWCETGRLSAGQERFDRLAENGFVRARRTLFWLATMALASEVAVCLDDHARTAQLYAQFEAFAGHTVTDGPAASLCFGSASRFLGLLAATLAHSDVHPVGWEEAQRHFEDAIAANARLGARPWLARTRHDYAAMLLARRAPGDRELAADQLTQSLRDAESLGMARLREQVNTLAVSLARDSLPTSPAPRPVNASGEVSPPLPATRPPLPVPPTPSPHGLTPREVEVLRLVAFGKTNKDIAADLGLSVPTVHRHIANIYAKIGARGRADATAYAIRHGIASADRA
jgi:DNA-binding CsgD family transcriptional regulator/tetratricopeptide (TPR) repeat protein